MDAWTVGLALLGALALAAIVYGALADRAMNRRRAAELLAPPQRTIPHFAPETSPPQYLSELQARRPPPAPSTELTATGRDRLRTALTGPGTVPIPVPLRGTAFVSDPPTGWAVLDTPRVLLCADPVVTVRELVGVLEKMVLSRTPLVILAPSFAPEVRATLEVNHIQRASTLLALEVTPEISRRVSEATGAVPVPRTDLQAGYVTPDQLGSCGRWVSDAAGSYVIDPVHAGRAASPAEKE